MRPSRTALLLSWLVLLALPAACSDEQEQARQQVLVQARMALQGGDDSGALHLARDGLSRDGGSPDLQLVAAEACIGLGRFGDALDYADAGLAAADDDTDLEADLSWAAGKALAGRYRELRDEDDWRRANTLLETGARAGHHRVQSAALLVVLQRLGGRDNPGREQEFGRLVLKLAPDSMEAEQIRKLSAAEGWQP